MTKYIDVKAFLEHMKGTSRYFNVKFDIESFPTADVASVVHGRWIEYPRAHYFKCSECKYTVPYKKAVLTNEKREYNYCPNCGAKMNGGENDA